MTQTNQKQATQSSLNQPLTPLPPTPSSPYKPLDQNRDCTRLIKIEAASGYSDPIVCNLSEVAFSERPKFDALSYVWGDGSADCSITLSGTIFRVRQNLSDALRYLRQHAPGISYWIDAICINQDDIAERNRQVRMMHHIYSRATTVVVWLGAGYAKYEAVLADLHRLGRCKQPNEQSKLELPAGMSQSGPPGAEISDEATQQRKLAKELYDDGYWNRLWIIQEIGRAREIKVCFGNAAVLWDLFVKFISMHNFGSEGPLKLSRQREGKYTGSSTLLQLLQDHKGAICQDRKDKVYGLVGLAFDARGLTIDYKKTPFEIWTDVMEFMNEHHLFARKDPIEVGDLVKSLLIDTELPLLQQILRPYEPANMDRMIIADSAHPKAFKLETILLGCVTGVGPHPTEIVGNFNQVDKWTEHVQACYQGHLGHAHEESDKLIRTILDLDDTTLSKECFDYRSIVQWAATDTRYLDGSNEVLAIHGDWIKRVKAKLSGKVENRNSATEQSSTTNSRLFRILNFSAEQTPCKMGLASSDIRVGDFLCRLQWSRRAVIVRPQQPGGIQATWKLQVVGTAVVTEDLGKRRVDYLPRLDWVTRYKTTSSVYLDASSIFALLV
ncbi:heterokaryon incompatibility protein-domain-containing protein [Mariannaea sp. PMI_226]|nr:heterokaryon incompatibility protein-domain-containing protein [Mariannaea sp. PMI_226]